MDGTPSEHVTDRIFDAIHALRIELGTKIDSISTKITAQATQCKLCAPVVLGNGKKPIGERMALAEAFISRVRWVLTAIVAPLVVYACYALFERYLKCP